MRLADFITSNLEPILTEWEAFARIIAADGKMDALALRDHAQDILLATVQDMKSSQSAAQRLAKSKGQGHGEEHGIALNGASELHAIDRLGSGFDLMEVVSEHRALRASVLQLWHDSLPEPGERDVNDLTRFNESIDQSVAKAVSSYTKRVDQARDMFLAILSHDLRNPLNSIAMTAQLLPQVGHADAERIGFAGQISNNAQVMARMIGDLLDYTRTAGRGDASHPGPYGPRKPMPGIVQRVSEREPKPRYPVSIRRRHAWRLGHRPHAAGDFQSPGQRCPAQRCE